MIRRAARAAVPGALCLFLAGCAVGPNYKRPMVPVPDRFYGDERAAEARSLADVPWWGVFDDPILKGLIEEAVRNGFDARLSAARVQEARARYGVVRSQFYPAVDYSAGWQRGRANQLLNPSGETQTAWSVDVGFSWELDLWGRIRRNVESNEASAQASAADLESTRLSIQSALAVDYFQLRALDAERKLLDETVDAFARSLDLTRKRKDQGVASQGDVAQAETQLESTRAQAIDVGVQRAQLEHGDRVLVGQPASDFTLAAVPLDSTPPDIPAGIPSELLERRPDVAAAERNAAAANAQIGVAAAAYYPSITISPVAGFETRSLTSLFEASSLLWSFGATVTQPLLSGGRLSANVDIAKANYDATVATYRRVVLTAMQEVEDGITGLAALERADRQARAAVETARKVLDLANARYEGGATTYLDVITAQQSLLSAERLAAQLGGQRLLISVFLIKALGGDWQGPG